MTPAAPLRTDRLRLDPVTIADATEMTIVLADAALHEFTGGEPLDVTTLERRDEALVAGSRDPTVAWLNWVVRTADDARAAPSAAVGYVQATVVGDVASVAWLTGAAHQGLGFATEAAQSMCEWLERAGVRCLDAHIHPLDVASQRVAAHLDLTRTGRVDDDGEEIWSRAGAS